MTSATASEPRVPTPGGARVAVGTAARGRPRVGSPRRGHGFTVIELAVAVLVVLIVTSVAVVAVGSLLRSRLRTSAMTLQAAIRYVYNLSVIRNEAHRLVIDIDGGAWWGETLPRGDKQCGAFLLPDEDAEAAVDSQSPEAADAHARAEQPPRPKQRFEKSSGGLIGKHALPKGVAFAGLLTEHHKDVQRDGTGSIYFFPTGYVERAYVYLTDGDATLTIASLPLQGRAVIHDEELDVRSFDRR